MIVEVFVAERDADHTLADERGDRMFDQLRMTRIPEAAREPFDQAQRLVGRSQQQPARVRRQRSAVEIGDDGPPFDTFKLARFRATLRLHRASITNQSKPFSQKSFWPIPRPDAPYPFEKCGLGAVGLSEVAVGSVGLRLPRV